MQLKGGREGLDMRIVPGQGSQACELCLISHGLKASLWSLWFLSFFFDHACIRFLTLRGPAWPKHNFLSPYATHLLCPPPALSAIPPRGPIFAESVRREEAKVDENVCSVVLRARWVARSEDCRRWVPTGKCSKLLAISQSWLLRACAKIPN